MTLDYKFLLEFCGHEIHRLSKVAGGLREDLEKHDANRKFFEKAIAAGSPRSQMYLKNLSEAEAKIAEADMKLSVVQPRIEKLVEQEKELEKLV